MVFDPESIIPPGAKIKVLGVGGGGGNAVNTMIRSNLEGVEFITANTDVQSLRFSLASTKLQLGKELTKGLGAGADPDIGRDAALEDRHEIQEVLADADMVFITAGMGGGTGTGGASVVAQIARELGALTVAVVTKPFNFEGKRRRKHADLGIARLRESVDTLITIPNQRLLQVATPDLSMIDAFKMADNVLVNAVRGISDIINIPGTVNVDFADVKTVMSSMGHALMGIGLGTGPSRAVDAARQAISSPLLEDVDIEGATGILINITAGSSVTLMEINDACSIIQEAAHEDANIIFGAVIDETMSDAIRVTVIATGFPVEGEESVGDLLAQVTAKSPSTIIQPFGSSRLTTPVNRPTPNYSARQPYKEPSRTSTGAPLPTAPNKPAPQQEVAKSIPRSPLFDSGFERPSPVAKPTMPPPEMTAKPVQSPVVQSQNVEAAHEPVIEMPMAAPSLAVISEAQELARWTLGESGTFADEHEAHAPWTDTSERIEDAPLSAAPETSYKTVSESIFEDFGDMEHPGSHLVSKERITGATTEQGSTAAAAANPPSASAPLESFFESDMKLVTDIDRKIDEALALADRLRAKPEAHGTDEDDLDVPAFLRNGMKDLPLG